MQRANYGIYFWIVGASKYWFGTTKSGQFIFLLKNFATITSYLSYILFFFDVEDTCLLFVLQVLLGLMSHAEVWDPHKPSQPIYIPPLGRCVMQATWCLIHEGKTSSWVVDHDPRNGEGVEESAVRHSGTRICRSFGRFVIFLQSGYSFTTNKLKRQDKCTTRPLRSNMCATCIDSDSDVPQWVWSFFP